MKYYEVLIADSNYHGSEPLTYSHDASLEKLSVVNVTLKQKMVTAFVLRQVKKPRFDTKPIKQLLSRQPLPDHCLKLAYWLHQYYVCNLGDALRQFAPSFSTTSKPTGGFSQLIKLAPAQLKLDNLPTDDQVEALAAISKNPSTTMLLHGDTGTGKTRIYIELARKTLAAGRSVMILTPEIALTPQLAAFMQEQLHSPVLILHSRLSSSHRRKIWLAILESKKPLIILGPRSALFAPITNLGLIVLDEVHEPAYKQEQDPRYHASRVASQLGFLTKSKVVLGTATPSTAEYYLAHVRKAVVRMQQLAISSSPYKVKFQVVDLKDRNQFRTNPYLSDQLIASARAALGAKKQVMIYLNRRGTARVILCDVCGWQLLCPNCDVPLVYHHDQHLARCHICGFRSKPPMACPECGNSDIIYKSIGTKSLVENITKLFPGYRLQRFDSDNTAKELASGTYSKLHSGEIDILVGTQILAKGFDLPRLGLVGVVTAESSLSLPDYTAEERTFQLLYQVVGRVGRGHIDGEVVIQAYNPSSLVIQAAIARDWQSFYKHSLVHRQQFRFPPFSYLAQLVCRRSSLKGAQQAANNLKAELLAMKLPVEIIGPAPNFYARRGKYYYYQLVIKAKRRDHLVELAKAVPSNWMINLDPIDLL